MTTAAETVAPTPYNAPGRADRKGLTLFEVMEMFPTEQAATDWFESVIWPNGRCCSKCGSKKTRETPDRKPMPYWCTDCRSYFSVRTGTPIARSKIPLRKWAIAIYLCLTSLKSVSSMKLHRDLGVSQPAAWFMLHRIREAWAGNQLCDGEPFDAEVEVDETYMGGKAKNMHARDRERRITGRGGADKTAVVGIKDRDSGRVVAEVVEATDAATLVPFVEDRTTDAATVYTDGHGAYRQLSRSHEVVEHSVGEYVRGKAHTNGIESFWSMLKRAHDGTFHKISPKHLQRYVDEFAAKHNIRDSGTVAQMRDTVARMVGHNLLYADLVAPNGLSAAGRVG